MKKFQKIGFFLLSLVAIKAVFSFTAGAGSFSLRDIMSSILSVQNIVSLTNQSREAAQLPGLRVDRKLQSAAQKKADDMLENQYFAHDSPAGKVAWDFLEESGYNYLFAGENLAMNFETSEEVTKGWLTSLRHKENILSKDFSQIGIGIAAGKFLEEQTTIVVQMFGAPVRASAPRKFGRGSAEKGKPLLLQGASLAHYIEQMHTKKVARWIPKAKAYSIYGVAEKEDVSDKVIDMILIYAGACAIGVFAYRHYKRRKVR